MTDWRWLLETVRLERRKRAAKPAPPPGGHPTLATLPYELPPKPSKRWDDRNRIRYLHKKLGICTYLSCGGLHCEARPRPG